MKWLRDLTDDFLCLFFPRLCLSCGETLVRGEEVICTRCIVEIHRTDYHLVQDNPLEQMFWGRCPVERGAAFSVYNRGSRIRTLIHLMKYKGAKDLGYFLGRMYGSYLKQTPFIEGVDMFMPVPLHPSRLKKRGYNQSEFIAQGLSDVTGIAVNVTALVRSSGSATQTHRRRYERWENVEGLFIVKRVDEVQGKHVMLVDDVITTGSTMEACADALLRCRGTRVSVVALAVTNKLTV